MPAAATVSVAEARNNFSRLAGAVAESGESITVFRNSKPWVVISPAKQTSDDTYEADVMHVLDRGRKDIEQGRFVGLDEFLARHRADADG